ncbi:MAG TPA: glycosyltransferase family 4 protein [Terriglobia bacterium]|nr:glycosyltransferase family 4 protein [Terriglobia bacterium]
MNEQELKGIPESATLVLASLHPALEHLASIRTVALRRKVPVTGIIHSLYGTSMVRGFLRLYLATLGQHDALICSSNAGQLAIRNIFSYTQECFKEIGVVLPAPPIQLPIIPLGINVSTFPKKEFASGRQLRVLYLGRLSTGSKADLYPLLIAWRHLQQDGISATLTIAGDDFERLSEPLRQFSQAIGCAQSVDVIPNPSREVKLHLYHDADVFVSPSDTLQETFGLTLLEAMASELPIVASDWSGYRDLVVHGKTGFLVSTLLPAVGKTSRDDSDGAFPPNVLSGCTAVNLKELESSLRVLLLDRERRICYGKDARRLAEEKFDWKIIIRRYEELWDYLARVPPGDDEHQGRLRLDEFSVEHLYGHYATSILKPDTLIRRVPVPRTPERESIMAAVANGQWKKTIVDVIEGITCGPISVAELGARIGQSTNQILICVGRLSKYGLVEVVSNPDRGMAGY